MPLEFTNVIKGVVTQNTLAVLFEQGGYRVTRLGIEELFGEIKYLDGKEYSRLDLPPALRYLPDLLIANLNMTNAFMVEVKYRRQFLPAKLHSDLKEQFVHWPQTHVVTMISEPLPPHPNASFHQDFIRVIRQQELDGLSAKGSDAAEIWDKLPHLHQAFKSLNQDAVAFQECADTLTQTIKDLSKLQPLDAF